MGILHDQITIYGYNVSYTLAVGSNKGSCKRQVYTQDNATPDPSWFRMLDAPSLHSSCSSSTATLTYAPHLSHDLRLGLSLNISVSVGVSVGVSVSVNVSVSVSVSIKLRLRLRLGGGA